VNEKEVTLIEVRNLKKYFQVGKNATLKAVDDVSFDIYKR
jgi:oligopeptide transport system ATP-binding protein